jgi:hypothetical protein
VIGAVWAFLWPGWDAVYPNLLASIICGTVVWVWAHRHIRHLHRRNDELQAKVAELHEKTQATTGDTNRIVRTLADQLGINPDTGENRLPRPRYDP